MGRSVGARLLLPIRDACHDAVIAMHASCMGAKVSVFASTKHVNRALSLFNSLRSGIFLFQGSTQAAIGEQPTPAASWLSWLPFPDEDPSILLHASKLLWALHTVIMILNDLECSFTVPMVIHN